MRESVIDGHFFSGGDVAQSIKLGAAESDTDEDVGLAGVIDVLERSAAHTLVHGVTVVEFDDGDMLASPGATARLTNGNALTCVLAYLGAGRDGRVSEKPFAFNPALSNYQHVRKSTKKLTPN